MDDNAYSYCIAGCCSDDDDGDGDGDGGDGGCRDGVIAMVTDGRLAGGNPLKPSRITLHTYTHTERERERERESCVY